MTTQRIWLPKGPAREGDLRALRMEKDPRVVESVYKGWIALLPCVACFRAGIVNKKQVVVAHVRMPIFEAGWRETGMQEKPNDRRTVPLCNDHHRDDSAIGQHQIGERKFWEDMGINPAELCAALSDAFDNGASGLAVIARITGKARREPWICVCE